MNDLWVSFKDTFSKPHHAVPARLAAFPRVTRAPGSPAADDSP
jgi:hypothetical protein